MAPGRDPSGDEVGGGYNMAWGLDITCEVSRASEVIVRWKREAKFGTL